MKEEKDIKTPAGKDDEAERDKREKQRKSRNPFHRLGAWLELDFTRPLHTVPHVGMRIFKTGVAVLAVFFFYLFVKRPENGLLMAMIATIVSLQDTVNKSLRIGVIRLIGTALGGLIGIGLIWCTAFVGAAQHQLIIAVMNSLGVVLSISICVWWGIGEGAVIACVVFTAIFLNAAGDSPYLYALNRMLDTVIGIVISVIVNLSIRRPKMREENPPEDS